MKNVKFQMTNDPVATARGSDTAEEMNNLQTKLDVLRDRICNLESALVAFSGGVDSTFVLRVAHDVLGDRVIGVTALSESLPTGELQQAQKLAEQIGARHVVLRTFETQNENYLEIGR